MNNTIRKNIFGILELWSSIELQLNYQLNVPSAQVSSELFCQWDDFYNPDSISFIKSFNSFELKILSDFNILIEKIANSLPVSLPNINQFAKSEEWSLVNDFANLTLKELKK